MCFFLALITLAAADDAEIITIPLPDAAGEVHSETSPWQDPAEEHAAPPIAWTQIGEHAVGDQHRLYDASGAIALSCKIQAFEVRITNLGAWESDGLEVWARLDCGREALAVR